MCEYQKVDLQGKPKAPTCKVTGELCTYCLYGNSNTYNSVKAKERESKGEKK